jgi:hypothetical protein
MADPVAAPVGASPKFKAHDNISEEARDRWEAKLLEALAVSKQFRCVRTFNVNEGLAIEAGESWHVNQQLDAIVCNAALETLVDNGWLTFWLTDAQNGEHFQLTRKGLEAAEEAGYLKF